jgi:transposase
MAAKTWNIERQRRLETLYRSQRYSVLEIANELGVSHPTVYNHLRRLGWQTKILPRRHKGPGKIYFTNDEKERIVAWKQDGMFSTTIAIKLRKSRTAVLRVIRELGLKNSNMLPLQIGERFASLLVLGPAAPKTNRKTGYRVAQSLVRCDCGRELALPNHALRCGNTKSCGGSFHRLKPETPWNRIMHQVKGQAKSRGVSMKLSLEQIKLLAQMPCAYCGEPGSNRMQGRAAGRTNGTERVRYNGLDQIVPCGGYDIDNVVPCCCICNDAKSDRSLTAFVTWLQSLGSSITEAEFWRKQKKLRVRLAALQ